jgi:cyanate permease
MTTWLQALLDPAGIGDSTSGVLLLEMVVAGILGSALLPPLIVRREATPAFLRVVVVLGAAGCVALAVLPRVAVAIVVVFVLGGALLTALPLLLEIVERRAGASGATGAALLWMAGNLGGLVVALIVQGLLGHPALAFLAMAVALVVGLPFTAGPRFRLAALTLTSSASAPTQGPGRMGA